MKNQISYRRHVYSGMHSIESNDSFHGYLIEHALQRYQEIVGPENMGSALAICANFREALHFKPFPFMKIQLTGVGKRSDEVRIAAEGDDRITYEEQNCEVLNYASASYDLVFCKEGLHHLTRPVAGLYEMLRVCKQAVIFIEPYDSCAIKLLELLKLTSIYERAPSGNFAGRDNYVFRWSRRGLESIINSYYLDSGYELELNLGWFSPNLNDHHNPMVRFLVAATSSAISFFPPTRGNMVTAIVRPGSNIPPDPGELLSTDTPF